MYGLTTNQKVKHAQNMCKHGLKLPIDATQANDLVIGVGQSSWQYMDHLTEDTTKGQAHHNTKISYQHRTNRMLLRSDQQQTKCKTLGQWPGFTALQYTPTISHVA